MSKRERFFRASGFFLCQIFTIFTIVITFRSGQYHRLPMALATVFLLFLPALSQRIFHFQFCLPFYLLLLFYALGPMLGQCYNLYYTLSWWDKMLHALGGIVFAVVGSLIYGHFSKQGQENFILCALFSLCFSMAISVLWEFVEFGADQLLGLDMQQDRLISGFHSYLLGAETGVTGSIGDISQVIVNGQLLPGYIDIGLFDTMTDMIWETAGALVVFLLSLCTRGKNRLWKAAP